MTARRIATRVAFLAVSALIAGNASAQTMPGMPASTTGMDLDRRIRVFALGDLLEYVPTGTGALRVDALGWVGGDYNRLYVRLDGNQPAKGDGGESALDVTYGRLLTPFWTGLVGGRVEVHGLGSSTVQTRTLLAAGFEGISPYWFEVEPTLYVSSKGDVSARFVTAVDVLFTQRLILQPRFETNLAVQAIPELGVGSGINDIELGARMRYEYTRKFAPYIGLSYFRSVGGTAGLARATGERVKVSAVVFGVRAWR